MVVGTRRPRQRAVDALASCGMRIDGLLTGSHVARPATENFLRIQLVADLSGPPSQAPTMAVDTAASIAWPAADRDLPGSAPQACIAPGAHK